MLKIIRKLLEEKKDTPDVFKRNLVKEYLQILVLSFLYSQSKYQNLIFYGGSCLKHCFNLPRLSEDLDFVDLKAKTNLKNLSRDLEEFFRKKSEKGVRTKLQKFRIYLKFPILYDLGLAKKGASNVLLLKIEIFKNFNFCKNYQIKIIPLFKFGEAILIRTFDFPTLMATKLRAILYRKWEKIDKEGKVFAKVKGRDYFDLMWYLEREIVPNLKCIKGIKTRKELKEKLIGIIRNLDTRSVRYDLEALIGDKDFINDLSKNIKKILVGQLEKF